MTTSPRHRSLESCFVGGHYPQGHLRISPSAMASSWGDKTRLANIKDWKYLGHDVGGP